MTGSLSLSIYDNTQSTAVKSFDNFITVVSTREKDDTGIKIKSNFNSTEYTLKLDGTELTVPILYSNNETINLTLSLRKNESGQEVLTLHFNDKLFSIPEDGGYVDLSLSSVNVTGEIVNTVYTNSSVLIPNKQKFSTTTQGSLVYDSEGALLGTTNNSSVNISFGASTSAKKSIYELENSENKTDSNQATNYITLQNKGSEFRYTLSVSNETNFPMKKLVLIDTLPKLNDTSPFDSNAFRGSEFSVHLSEIPNFSVKITYSNGTVKVLSSDEYKIDFKTDTTLTSSDWKGAASWSDSAENAEAIRLIIEDTSSILIPNEAVVEFSFNAKAESSATAGMKAWNSFGYHYILDNSLNTELEAMPLAVGVKIPDTPLIQKSLIDIEGNDYCVNHDTIFSFLIYQGEKRNYSTADELIQALVADNIPYQRIDLRIDKDKSTASQKMLLEYDTLTWIDGQKYTIVELPTDDIYKLDSWNYVSQDSVTFTYSPDKSDTLLCENIYTEWAINIIKSDSENSDIKLENAGFAVYSPNSEDQISDSDYEALGLKAEKTKSYDDKSWYLKDVKMTYSNGEIKFENLLRDEYCIIEVESPEGYILTAEPKIITNNSRLQEIEIFNRKAPILPDTGSKGVFNFISFGMGLIFALTVFMLVGRLKHYKDIK